MSLLQSRQWGSAVWGSTAFVPYVLWVKVTDYPLWVNNTAAITAHIHSWRYRMALQPLSQIVTWANRLLDRFLCFPMLTDCCGQSVGAALNLKERNQGMIYSLLVAVKKNHYGASSKMIRQRTKEVVLPYTALSKTGTRCHGMLWGPK